RWDGRLKPRLLFPRDQESRLQPTYCGKGCGRIRADDAREAASPNRVSPGRRRRRARDRAHAGASRAVSGLQGGADRLEPADEPYVDCRTAGDRDQALPGLADGAGRVARLAGIGAGGEADRRWEWRWLARDTTRHRNADAAGDAPGGNAKEVPLPRSHR